MRSSGFAAVALPLASRRDPIEDGIVTSPFIVTKTGAKSEFDGDALLFIDGFHGEGEGRVRLSVFHHLQVPLGNVWRTQNSGNNR